MDDPISPAEREAIKRILAGQRVRNQSDLLINLLDKGYDEAVSAVIRAIDANSNKGVMAQRLKELEEEAARLAENDQRMTPDNAVFRATLADFEATLRKNAQLIQGAAPDVQASALSAAERITLEMAVTLADGTRLAAMAARWNVPDPDAVAAIVDYTSKPAFQSLFTNYEAGVWETARNQAVRGMVEGWNPIKTAREVRRVIEGLPISEANNMLRTLQLTSWRDATVVHQVANADMIESVIRIAVLDGRTCMACVALHGTRLQPGERVDDHWQGRCTSIVGLKGYPRQVQTGEAWFNSLPERKPLPGQPITQEMVAGPGNLAAMKAGQVRLQDFVHRTSDPLFGMMVSEQSLKGLLGGAARQYYGG